MDGTISAAEADAPLVPGGAGPVTDDDFARLMAAFEPFEGNPSLAIAVSGGADSLALTLLADRWARAHGGSVHGLTVDHGLRAEAAEEARQVGDWLGACGIAHTRLYWRPEITPTGNIQARAREARYALMEEWCAGRGVLHLALAHHRDDQAETLLLRLARGSGLYGLSGMSAVEERRQVRLIRPLLALPPARLRATLGVLGQAWLEDPSNRDPAYARVRMRQGAAALTALGLGQERLAATAGDLARARRAIGDAVDQLLATSVELAPGGFAWLDRQPLAAASGEVRLRALASLLATISGSAYPPRFEQLARLDHALKSGALGAGSTLCGCRIAPDKGRILVFREPAAVAPPISLDRGGIIRWDARFQIDIKSAETLPVGLSIGAVGIEPARTERRIAETGQPHHVPPRARRSLPGLWLGARLVEVPHLGWSESGTRLPVQVAFRPLRPLTGGGFS